MTDDPLQRVELVRPFWHAPGQSKLQHCFNRRQWLGDGKAYKLHFLSLCGRIVFFSPSVVKCIPEAQCLRCKVAADYLLLRDGLSAWLMGERLDGMGERLGGASGECVPGTSAGGESTTKMEPGDPGSGTVQRPPAGG